MFPILYKLTPVLIASILLVLSRPDFFFHCYSSNTDLKNNSSDFTACCGVMKFTPISDLRRAFLTVFSGWVCLSQLLEKFSEWETEKANSISICIIW